MNRILCALAALPLCAVSADDAIPPVSERAARVHNGGVLIDGHNDLPWRLRQKGDMAFTRIDVGKNLPTDLLQTDLPRLRAGGVKAQFWSVYVPDDIDHPARAVTGQIDLVRRMIDRYPDQLELALSADDIERIVRAGKVASLIGIEGGVAIENDLAQLRAFHLLGARYMTLTHSHNHDWADSATDKPKHGGLTVFGERVVQEMNRLGMLVDISHVSADTMRHALRIAKAPVIASHSSAFALCPHPRNVPDDVLKQVAANGGVIMVNFYSGFIVKDFAKLRAQAQAELKAKHPDPAEFKKAFEHWPTLYPNARGRVATVADHIDHIAKLAGIDHVGIGSDFDGIMVWPIGLDDVSDFPRLTQELLNRGYSEENVHKVLGGNLLRAFRKASAVADELARSTAPEVDSPPAATDCN